MVVSSRSEKRKLPTSAGDGEKRKVPLSAGDGECLLCSKRSRRRRRRSCDVVSARTRLMEALREQGRIPELESLFDSIAHDGHRPSPASCALLLASLCSRKLCEKAESRLVSMIEDGLAPDAICYNYVIDAFCELGRMPSAVRIFDFMQGNGCKSKSSTFNTLIKGYGLSGQPLAAQDLFAQMTSHSGGKAKPDVRTYNMLLNALCRNSMVDDAWSLVLSMGGNGVHPDVVTFNTMASAFAEKGLISKAELVIREMHSLQIQPTPQTYGILINALCAEGHVDRALALVNKMSADGLPPNLVILNTLVRGYSAASQFKEVEQVLGLMISFGFEPNLRTYSTIMDAWCSTGLFKKAKVVMERMVNDGIKVDATVYGILVKGYIRGQEPQMAESLVQNMWVQGVAPNVVIFTTVISGWCNIGRMNDAMRVYREMVKHCITPNLRTFQTLIWGFKEARLPSKAEDVLLLMRKQDIIPDEKVLKMIADAWRDLGLEEEASRFLSSQKVKTTKVTRETTSSDGSLINQSAPAEQVPFSQGFALSSDIADGLTLSSDAFAFQKQTLMNTVSRTATPNAVVRGLVTMTITSSLQPVILHQTIVCRQTGGTNLKYFPTNQFLATQRTYGRLLLV